MRKQNQGSAMIIVIVVLMVAILGALGFVIYNQMSNNEKPSDNSSTSQSESTQSTAAPESEDGTVSLRIEEWSVKGSYADSDYDFTYSLSADDTVALTTSLLESESCSAGSIVRGSGTDTYPADIEGSTYAEAYDKGYGAARVQLGSLYYFAIYPQDSCGNGDPSEEVNLQQKAASDAMVELVNSLEYTTE